MNKIYSLLISFSILLTPKLYAADTDALHFHVVKKTADSKYVSTIPRVGYAANGKIKHRYNPNSIVYQQHELIERLTAEQEELDRMEEIEYRESILKDGGESESFMERIIPNIDTSIIQRSSGKGVLEDLIELEKRAGRAKAPE